MQRAHARLTGIDVGTRLGQQRRQTRGEQTPMEVRHVAGPVQLFPQRGHRAALERRHQFDVALVLGAGTIDDIRRHLAHARRAAEFAEGREEMVVAADAAARHEATH